MFLANVIKEYLEILVENEQIDPGNKQNFYSITPVFS